MAKRSKPHDALKPLPPERRFSQPPSLQREIRDLVPLIKADLALVLAELTTGPGEIPPSDSALSDALDGLRAARFSLSAALEALERDDG